MGDELCLWDGRSHVSGAQTVHTNDNCDLTMVLEINTPGKKTAYSTRLEIYR